MGEGGATIQQERYWRRTQEQKKKQKSTTPTPSELKQRETKEFAEDIKGVVESSVVYTPEEYEKEVVKPLESALEQELELQKEQAHREGVPEEQISQWEQQERGKFKEYLKSEVYPRRLPSAGEKWIRKPTLAMPSTWFYQQAERQRQMAKTPGLGMILGSEKAAPMWEFAGGTVESIEATSQLFFPAPAPPPPPPKTPARYAGIAAGSLAQGFVIGKIFEEPIAEFSKWIGKTRVGKAATKLGTKFRQSRVYRKWYEWTAPHYKPYGKLVPGEVVIPPIEEPLSYTKLKASEVAWTLTQAPKTSGVWTGKYFIEPPKKTLPHLIARGGQVSVGYLQELGFQRGLQPLTTQSLQTRLGIYPYIPSSASAASLSKLAAKAPVGIGFAQFFKPQPQRKTVIPKPPKPLQLKLEPTGKRKKLEYLPPPLTVLTPQLTQEEKKKPKPIPIRVPRISAKQWSKAKPKVSQIPVQAARLKTMATQGMPTLWKPPTPPQPPIKPFYNWRRRGGQDVIRSAERLFGVWFKRTHPIKSPRELMESFLGKRRREKVMGRKRKRRSRKRRKR